MTGGFTTGGLLAGGPLREHERELAAKHGLPTDSGSRLALNRHFLTEIGLAELVQRLDRGTYRIGAPEEGALLVVAWLIRTDHREAARELLDVLVPYFDRLRFYPEPADQPQRLGARVFVQDVNAVVDSLRAVRPNVAIATQREAIEVWTPLYDEAVGLFLETVVGPPPTIAGADDGKARPREDGSYLVKGGWPCRTFPVDWSSRANDLLRRLKSFQEQHTLSSKPRHRKSSLAQLTPYLRRAADDPASLSERDVTRIRLLLARYVAKRGLPDSDRCRRVRARQAAQARTPIHSEAAAVVIPRLQAYPGSEGIEDLAPVVKPITDDEAPLCGLEPGDELPDTIRRRVERCLCESVEALVERGLIPSGDVLAQVLPQLVSGLQAAGIDDPSLRRLHAAIYRAFRCRRSLLLLDLQSQVRIDELPWAAAIERFRSESLDGRKLNRQTLEELTTLALVSFPQAIFPNKLVQEMRTLARGAGLDVVLVDELAADIFMGKFSKRFQRSAEQAAKLMDGTLYQTYYGIDYERIRSLGDSRKGRFGFALTSGDLWSLAFLLEQRFRRPRRVDVFEESLRIELVRNALGRMTQTCAGADRDACFSQMLSNRGVEQETKETDSRGGRMLLGRIQRRGRRSCAAEPPRRQPDDLDQSSRAARLHAATLTYLQCASDQQLALWRRPDRDPPFERNCPHQRASDIGLLRLQAWRNSGILIRLQAGQVADRRGG